MWLGEDIRQFGSGNIGATNVLRTVGVVPAILVLLLDAAKGVVGVYLGGLVGEDFSRVLCGIAAIAGHNWSAYLGFRGGKGIATSAGVLFALWPHIGLILLGVFLLVVGITRYISLGSVTVAVIFPILLLLFRMPLRILLAGLVLSFFCGVSPQCQHQASMEGTGVQNRRKGPTAELNCRENCIYFPGWE